MRGSELHFWFLYKLLGLQGNKAARLSGQVNNADSTSNNWHITGVQLEVGTYTAATLPPFQHEQFWRYYSKLQEILC